MGPPSFLEDFAQTMDARTGSCLFLLFVSFTVATVLRCASKLFWYDELISLHLCALPNLADVWHALRAGVDLNPPLQYLLLRSAAASVGSGPVGFRTPMILSFLLASVCLYLFLRRHLPVSYATTGMLLFWLTDAHNYATEARPYALMLGFSAAALLCWVRACHEKPRGIWLAGLSLSLALALLSHCYAVLLAVPFMTAEGVRLHQSRRPDWGMWSAMALAAAPLALYPALASVSSSPVSAKSPFWPTIASVPDSYRVLLDPVAWPLVLGSLFIAVASRRGTKDSGDHPVMPAAELGALAGFAAIPVFAVVVSMLTTHSYLPRYGIESAIGISGLFAWMANHCSGASRQVGAFLVLLFAGCVWIDAPASMRTLVERNQNRATLGNAGEVPGHPLLSGLARNDSPIVVANGLAFLQIDYYANPTLARRIYYLTDIEAALRHTGSAGLDATYPTLKRMLPVRGRVARAGTFLAQNRSFLLYSNGMFLEWLMPVLLERGYAIRVRAQSGPSLLAEVTGPG